MYVWAFRIFEDKYQVPERVPIVRIVGKLSASWGSNLPRISTSGAKAERFLGLVRGDLKAMGTT